MSQTTGKFKTREELEKFIWFAYNIEDKNLNSKIALEARVSVSTVCSITKDIRTRLSPANKLDVPAWVSEQHQIMYPLDLSIGYKYYNVLDMCGYTVTHEDSMCFYLCKFKGSSSKIISVSKNVVGSMKDFTLSRIDAMKENLRRSKMMYETDKKHLKNMEDRIMPVDCNDDTCNAYHFGAKLNCANNIIPCYCRIKTK